MNKHDKALERILKKNAHKIVPDRQVVMVEPRFYDGPNLVAEPDGIIWDGQVLHIIEYKATARHEDRARHQLNKAQQYIENDLGIYIPIKKIFLTGDNNERNR